MYKFMQRYNKKLMAVFAAVLVVAFFVPQFSKTSRTPSDVVFGQIGDEKITAQDVRDSRFLWDLLKGQVAIADRDPGTGRPILVPLAMVLGGPDESLRRSAFEQIE